MVLLVDEFIGLFLEWALTGDQILNTGLAEWRSDPLSCPARAHTE